VVFQTLLHVVELLLLVSVESIPDIHEKFKSVIDMLRRVSGTLVFASGFVLTVRVQQTRLVLYVCSCNKSRAFDWIYEI